MKKKKKKKKQKTGMESKLLLAPELAASAKTLC